MNNVWEGQHDAVRERLKRIEEQPKKTCKDCGRKVAKQFIFYGKFCPTCCQKRLIKLLII